MARRLPFSGSYTVQLDAKRRAILPAPLRKLAEQELASKGEEPGEFYLTLYAPGCLHLYTSVGFRRQLKRMRRNLRRTDPKQYETYKDAYDCFLHESVNLKIGEQGRLLIPPSLFEKFGLAEGESVLIVGSDEMIELWSPTHYEARFGALRKDPVQSRSLMMQLSREMDDDDEEDDDD